MTETGLTIDEILDDFSDYAGEESRRSTSVNSVSPDGETPLHWMSTLGDARAIELLVGAGANVNAQDTNGNAPLHAAVQSRQLQAVEALVQSGANLLLPNSAGFTPLELSQQEAFQPVLRYLERKTP